MEIREAKDFLERVIESSRDGIIISDERGHIILVTQHLRRLVGSRERN